MLLTPGSNRRLGQSCIDRVGSSDEYGTAIGHRSSGSRFHPTRPEFDLSVVFGNQQHTLDREVIRSEARFAASEVSAFSDFVALVTCPDNLESFITAVAVASSML
jgi:hypothetical protein